MLVSSLSGMFVRKRKLEYFNSFKLHNKITGYYS